MENYLYPSMQYEHENYLADIERKEWYKKDLFSKICNFKLPFFKKRRVLKLARTLYDMEYLLSESEQRRLVLNEEVWSCDCLEYNVNIVYDFIVENIIEPQMVDVQRISQFCRVENDIDINFIRMNDSLRRSKEKNPIIVLINDMFVQPFIINGNHRILNAYKNRCDKIELYIIHADFVVNALISDDYIKAYTIYQELYRLIGMKLNC